MNFSLFDRLYVKFVVRIWSRNNSLQQNAIRRFHALEVDSMWQLHQLIKTVKTPKERAEIFQHLMEEESHADIFCEVYENTTKNIFTPEPFIRTNIAGSGGFERSILAIHAGEKNATEQFRLLSEVLPDGHLRSALLKIVEDESGHIDLTADLAAKLGVSKATVRKHDFIIRWQRLSKRSQRTAGVILNFLTIRILALGYWALGWLAARPTKEKFNHLTINTNTNYKKAFLP